LGIYRGFVNWKPKPADLVISSVMALCFPVLAGFLYTETGALLPIILYYFAAWSISIFRRGGSGYHFKNLSAPPVWFYINLAVIAATLVVSFFIRVETENPYLIGVLCTGVIWAVANASTEQLLWLYIFDAWDLYKKDTLSRTCRVFMRTTGLVLFSLFIGTIHALFWAKFLHTVNATGILAILFILGTTVSGYLHILVWRKSSQMLYTFIPHFMLNLFPLVWTGYSILPYLLKAGPG